MLDSNKTNIEYVLDQTRKHDVKFIRLWFNDILGNLKGFAINSEELPNALTRGMNFDGSTIQGFTRNNETDMYAVPDPSTFAILPWRPKTNAVARIFCNILTPDGNFFEGDPRNILIRNIKKASKLGYTYYVAPELEYFYFHNSLEAQPLDQGTYFDQISNDTTTNLRRETVLTLEEMGIPVEASHHEVAPGQHEINLRHTDALTMADNILTCKAAIKEIAAMNGYYATFMPKPIKDLNGSGMHIHQSLFQNDKNAFFANNNDYLSKTARHFIAGLLEHAPEITSVTNQWINSYKRLVPAISNETLGYEAPTHVSWAKVNKSDLIRIPDYKKGRETSSRIEYRSPDPACNPYLTFSVLLASGLSGITNKSKLPPPNNIHPVESYKSGEQSKNLKPLPKSLSEAINLTKKSSLVKETLGNHAFSYFIQNKEFEYNQYRTQITDYEIKHYLPIL